MAKANAQTDVLVLGDHPCAHLATALLKQVGNLRVLHACLPDEKNHERLVLVNPEFFELHALLGSLKRKLDLTPVYGLRFLSDDPSTSNGHANKTVSGHVASFKQIHAAMAKVAEEANGHLLKPSEFVIHGLDEKGVEVQIDKARHHPKLLILAGELPVEMKKQLGLSPAWDDQVPHRYTYLKLKSTKLHDPGSRPIIPMSLDLKGTLNWAWLMAWSGYVQLAVDQPAAGTSPESAVALLKHWADVLASHDQLHPPAGGLDFDSAVSMELPLAGALAQEGVANRTLLIGPAGGFYSACGEDIYPNCWSAIHAVDVAKKALKEPHLQDALQPYRLRWGATLGDYLRGPHQNLRFLLPLVYRNAAMSARLADAILFGKSVVR
jgi:flavin-dependent dehydrogenase